MPSSTPNQNIPYPLSTDNVNVQQDIQNVAEAIDNSLTEFAADIEAQNVALDTAINETIPTLINELGIEQLLGDGLTWGQVKGV
jgi:hypothetical protein